MLSNYAIKDEPTTLLSTAGALTLNAWSASMADLPVTDETEIWKPVVGYSKYQVSNLGNVRGKGGKVLVKKLQLGYHLSSLYIPVVNTHRNFSNHRLVAEAFGLDMSLGTIDHINCIKTDNRLSNLRPMTVHHNVATHFKRPFDLRCIKVKTKKSGRIAYEVHISMSRKVSKYIGTYYNVDDAKVARDKAEKELKK